MSATVIPFIPRSRQITDRRLKAAADAVLCGAWNARQGGDPDLAAIDTLAALLTAPGALVQSEAAVVHALERSAAWLQRAHAAATVHALSDDSGWQHLSGAVSTQRAFAIAGALRRTGALQDWIRWSTGRGVQERAESAEGFWSRAATEIE